MQHSFDFEATTGAGDETVQVTMSYKADKYSTWAENIESVTFNGMDVMGLLTEEQFADLEAKGIRAMEEKKVWDSNNYEP